MVHRRLRQLALGSLCGAWAMLSSGCQWIVGDRDRRGGPDGFAPGEACGGFGGLPIVLADKQAGPAGIAVDATTVFWANIKGGAGTIASVSKAGGPMTVLTQTERALGDLVLDVDRVYWLGSAYFHCVARGVPKKGGALVDLGSSACDSPLRMRHDGIETLFISGGFSVNAGSGVAIYRLPTSGAAPGKSVPLSLSVVPLAVDGLNVFFADANTIYRTDPNLAAAPTRLAENQPLVQDLATDEASLYWIGGGRVMRVGKSASAEPPMELANVGDEGARLVAPRGDPCAYWTLPVAGKVMGVPKAGGAAIVVASGQGRPFGIAVDATGVYWTNQEDGTVMKRPR